MTLLATTICPFNHHIQSIHIGYYHIYTTDLGKKIVTISRVIGIITREIYTKKIGFKLLGDNIKVFY
jgi:hypothetical protein